MGASITMAAGLHRAEPGRRHVAFLGDSTFFHSGVTGLINAVYNRADITVVILDNRTTAMTGHQPHPGMGKTAMAGEAVRVDIASLVKACE
jgi:indolepyruvate ferredoxin oxidoreductase alpha subunit